jgi:hypothetical protein
LKQACNNEQSRGVLRLEKSEEVSNMILENSKNEDDGIPMYTVDNSELDDFLDEATATQAEAEHQEQAEQTHEQQQKQPKVSAQEAMSIAVAGLGQITKIASDLTGKEIVVGEIPTTLFAILTAPLIQKYKPKMTIDPENVNLDSWMPELMALTGVGVAGVPIWFQVNNEETSEVMTNGDKPKSST